MDFVIANQEKVNAMIKTTLKIDGMMCGMCESHMNDLIRCRLPRLLTQQGLTTIERVDDAG